MPYQKELDSGGGGFDFGSIDFGAIAEGVGGLFGPSELDIMREQRAAQEAQASAATRYAAIQQQTARDAATYQARIAQTQAGVSRTMMIVGGAVILGGIGLFLWYRKTTRE